MRRKLRLIRGSEVSSFLADRMAWKYRWVDRLIKRTPDGKLFFGNLFHKHMEHLYNTGVPSLSMEWTQDWLQEQDTSAMDDVTYKELVDLFEQVALNYEDYYLQQDMQRMDVIATEFRFAVPLFDDNGEQMDIAYEGTIDLLYFENNELKFKDYKTVSSIDRYISNAILDRQISRYWWAITALCEGFGYIYTEDKEWVHVKDHPIYERISQLRGPSEFIYDIVKKEAPKPPELLKKGGLSKAKNQNTTVEMYRQAIEDHGLNPADYEDILQHLEDQGNKFLRRIPVRRIWSECEAAMDDFTKVALEMMWVRDKVEKGDMSHVYWNITWDTPKFNSYFPIIQAEVKGENVEMVKAMLYRYETEDEWKPEDDYIEVRVDE